MAGRGGRRPGSGRKKGTPNKATVERVDRERAEREEAQAKVQSAIDNAIAGRQELGKAALERYMKLSEGIAKAIQPPLVMDPATGQLDQAKFVADPKWEMFGEWFDRMFYCAKELTKYQSPTFKAIAVHAPMEGGGIAPKIITPEGDAVEGEKVTSIITAESATRIYEQMIASVDLRPLAKAAKAKK